MNQVTHKARQVAWWGNLYHEARTAWQQSGCLTYKIPDSQIPYVTNFDLGDITVDEIQLPAQGMRFEFGGKEALLWKAERSGRQHLIVVIQHKAESSVVHAQAPIDKTTIQAWLDGLAINLADGMTEAEYRGLLATSVKTILGVLFVRTGYPHFFNLEILAKDRADYDEARRKGLQDRIETIEARAKRRRKGEVWQFHTGSTWVADLGEAGEPLGLRAVNSRGEVTCAYAVRGHLKRQRHGTGNKLVKIIFVAPQVRRADLMPGQAADNGSLAL